MSQLHLEEPYACALGEALAFIYATWSPVAIIASGSIVRGNPDPSSDLDLVVIHEQSWRQRAQRRFNGVPAEIFVNPEFQLRRTFPAEAASIRPTMLHMVATGAIVHDSGGIAAGLQSDARALLDEGPKLAPETLTILKYGAVGQFEDAVDIAGHDADRARMVLLDALDRVAVLAFVQAGQWMPRNKELLGRLPEVDAVAAFAIHAAINAPSIHEALALAAPVVERVAGSTGFFEWTGEPQNVKA